MWDFFRRRKLKNKTKDNTSLFTLKGKTFIAKCIDVYDGDSITVIFKFNGEYQQFKVRMLGYDSPELRTKNQNEKEYALEAKRVLSDQILNRTFKLECSEFDKYGRLLGVVYIDGINVNEWMVRMHYGIPYTGGTKQKIDWKLGETKINQEWTT